MLSPIRIPGLFITGTDTGVGKTMIAGGIADWFRRRGAGVGVCKPVATGCASRREGLVSEDAELLAYWADTRFPLEMVCPCRYAEPLAPAVAAARADVPLDWSAIERSLSEMSRSSDVMIVEGVGGILVPMDERYGVLDMAGWLRLPALVVARPGLGTINHTLLTIAALLSRNVPIAGVVINRYPGENATIAEEINPDEIRRIGRVPILSIVPDEPFHPPTLPAGVVAALATTDWSSVVARVFNP